MIDDCGGLLPHIAAREDEGCLADGAQTAWLTRAAVRAMALATAERLRTKQKAVVLILADNRIATVLTLLASAAAGHVAMLIDPMTRESALTTLLDAYRPDFVHVPEGETTWQASADYAQIESELVGTLWRHRTPAAEPAPDPKLQLMLSTSGTTGSAKFVRLSQSAVTSNAAQIAGALEIDAADVAIGHLPPHYSYGLSVITSHLVKGAAVALVDGAVTDREIWENVERWGGTHFPGVPFHYNVLVRFGIERLVPKSVVSFTQAGGRLDPKLQTRMQDQVKARGGRFYVMYGQTEAAPRMTTLPYQQLTDKLGSVGTALADASLSITDAEGTPLGARASGNVVYTGPNVMMGYAETRADLAKDDEYGGRLETGDVGWMDEDGFLFLTGRTKRFAKLYGLRLSLDEVEHRFAGLCDVAAFDLGERILLIVCGKRLADLADTAAAVALDYKIPASSLILHETDELPRRPSGKIDYEKARGLYVV